MCNAVKGGFSPVKRALGVIAGVAMWLFLCPPSSSAIELSSFEFMLGDAWNFDTNLSISQKGYLSIDLTAEYETRPFERPLYWAFRFGFNREERGAWELQLIHHKIHLTNTTDEIQHFEITHGFNILTFNRSFEGLPFTLRAGAGLVVAHPESTIRDLSWYDQDGVFGSGYHLTGPALTGGIGKSFRLSSRFFFGLEAQVIAAWAKVPVAEGEAKAPNVAIHGMAGLGYRF
jgi:hypothetical protein